MSNASQGSLGQPLARGRTAEVYAYQAGRVLKLFREGWAREAAEREAQAGTLAHRTGAGAPRLDALVQVGTRIGIVYARVDGPSLLGLLTRQPWTLLATGRRLAALHAVMHRRPATGLPPQREQLQRAIGRAAGLSVAARARVLDALASLPDGDRLCHGDFHPDNVILTDRAPVVIDWLTATAGNPLADVARTQLLLTGGAVPPGSTLRLHLLALVGRQALNAVYLRQYAASADYAPGALRNQVAAWRLPIAAARLAEGIEEEAAALRQDVEVAVRRG